MNLTEQEKQWREEARIFLVPNCQANMYWMFRLSDDSNYTNKSFNLNEFLRE